MSTLLLGSPDPGLPVGTREELEQAYAAIQIAYANLSAAQVSGEWVEIPPAQSIVTVASPSTYVIPPDFGPYLSYVMLTPTVMLFRIAIGGATLTVPGTCTEVNFFLPPGYTLDLGTALIGYQAAMALFFSVAAASFSTGVIIAGIENYVSVKKSDFSTFITNDLVVLQATILLRVNRRT